MTIFDQIYTICRNTFTESLRQPIFVIMLMLVSLALVLNVSLSAYTMSDDNKLLYEMGLSTVLLGGVFLAALTATGVLSREIDNKTVLTVISKPIGRPVFVLGKYLGVTGAILLAGFAWSIVYLLTVRHKVMAGAGDQLDMPVIVFGCGATLVAIVVAVWGNYFYRWNFASVFATVWPIALAVAYLLVLIIDKDWNFQPITAEFRTDASTVTNYGEEAKNLAQIMIALVLVLEGLAIISAIAVACSTRLGQVMTLVICTGVFILGLFSDSLFGRFADTYWAATLAYAVPPNLQLLWMTDVLVMPNKVITVGYVWMVSAYSLLYVLAMLCLAVALFQTRETG
jgi:ABC-type transport system involved in multi-copper enzyme maturation permease subunit